MEPPQDSPELEPELISLLTSDEDEDEDDDAYMPYATSPSPPPPPPERPGPLEAQKAAQKRKLPLPAQTSTTTVQPTPAVDPVADARREQQTGDSRPGLTQQPLGGPGSFLMKAPSLPGLMCPRGHSVKSRPARCDGRCDKCKSDVRILKGTSE